METKSKTITTNNKLKPILVTGSHRSGTTWVGRMLTVSPALYYVHEPFNPNHPPGAGICNIRIKTWFKYITEENQQEYLRPIQDMLDGKYSLLRDLKTVRSKRTLKQVLKRAKQFKTYQTQHRTPLIKDPIALFSAPWFYKNLDCRIVIMIRHPAAFVNSMRTLGWHFDFSFFLEQPLLLRDLLPGYEDELRMEQEKLASPEHFSFIKHGAIFWNLMYHTIKNYQENYPDWHFLRHEDISSQPIDKFRRLYTSLGLNWNQEIEQTINQNCTSENSASPLFYVTKRDSQREIGKYKLSLTPSEIDQIREITQDISQHFYTDEEW